MPVYTVSYDANGATSGTAPASQTKTHGIDLTLATNSGNLAKTGYNFSGWNTAADGSGTHYAEGATYSTNANLSLYAEWTIPIAYGMIYDFSAESIGLANFAKVPKIYGIYDDIINPLKDKKANLKIYTKDYSVFPKTVESEWKTKVSFINKTLWDKSKTCLQNLDVHQEFSTPLDVRLFASGKDNTGKEAKGKDSKITIQLYPPVITGIYDSKDKDNEIETGAPGQTIILKGKYFGTAIPVVYLEYPVGGVVKALKMKVDKTSFIYKDSKHNPSPMNYKDGKSEIEFTLPLSFPKSWNHNDYHNIVIDNKISRSSKSFKTTSK